MSSNFFAELLVRFFSGNPKFFKIIQVVALVVTALSAALNTLPTDSVPSWLTWVKGTVVWVSGIVTVILAQLPNKS